MFRKPFIFVILAAALITSGCMSQSDIQSKYVGQQDACRAKVARTLSNVKDGAENPAASTAAGVQFSECMNKAGWHVSMPKPSQVASGPAPNPPTGSPSTNPSAAMTTVAPSEGTSAITRGQHPGVAANPPSGAPSVAPSAASARSAAPVTTTAPTVNTPSAPLPASAPATYQPARPVPTMSPNYGQGAGRQF